MVIQGEGAYCFGADPVYGGDGGGCSKHCSS